MKLWDVLCCVFVWLFISKYNGNTHRPFLFPSSSFRVCRPDEITPRYERIRSLSYLETRCIQTLSAVKWIRSAEISTVEFGVKWERLCCVTTGSRWNCGIVQVHICKITAKHHVKFHRKLCLRWLDKGAIVSVPTETRSYIHLSRYEWKTTHLRCVRAAQPS